MYKINWDIYRQCVSNLNTPEHREVIHEMVRHYLFISVVDLTNTNCFQELLNMGILESMENQATPTEERRNIVQPFNFMGNDRPQGN